MESSSLSRPDYFKYVMRTPNPVVTTQEAPFILQEGEKVHLRIFLDKSIMEVFANNRQCITQVIYPTLKDAIYVRPFTEDAPIKIENIQSWKLFPAMQW
jgi:sucrose-6-phosphate hydrolase SacC (GH32 family)